mgnify:FL=1
MLDVRGNFVEYNFFVNNSHHRSFYQQTQTVLLDKKTDWITVLVKKRRSSFVATKLLKLLSSLKSLIFPTLSRVRHVNDTHVTSHDTHKHHRNKVVYVIVKGQQKKKKREQKERI